MPKLTLSVDASVVSRAKQIAKQRGISVSKMVEGYLETVSQELKPAQMPPVLRSLRGALKKADPAEYYAHLSRKHR